MKNEYGYLHIIMGPMFSGKTSRLINLYELLKVNNEVLTINHTLDNRYGVNKISTHDKREIPCYNFKKLRIELEAEGIWFRSQTDTEVVLNALAKKESHLF